MRFSSAAGLTAFATSTVAHSNSATSYLDGSVWKALTPLKSRSWTSIPRNRPKKRHDALGFKNYGWDQVITGKGQLNVYVRWESSALVTAEQCTKAVVALQDSYSAWMKMDSQKQESSQGSTEGLDMLWNWWYELSRKRDRQSPPSSSVSKGTSSDKAVTPVSSKAASTKTATTKPTTTTAKQAATQTAAELPRTTPQASLQLPMLSAVVVLAILALPSAPLALSALSTVSGTLSAFKLVHTHYLSLMLGIFLHILSRRK
ncbi:hypothetical protein FGADI_8421 [Fusarium gaditjirri]|uniref:Uncharacterized protein n=1 Tax=Fusarium gaditjirri TaxID=282569 RepID=A0A8H4T2J5_9HYPO|nr:hypothetical protein FGADI_8421 [Fusarium gaditjirri]